MTGSAMLSKDAAIEVENAPAVGERATGNQQWLLRSNSGPSFRIGGPLGAEGLVEERKSLMVSRLGSAR
jgi:hypothetical protein